MTGRTRGRGEAMLKLCAWGVHLYTAMGAVAGLISLDRIASGDFRGAFIAMAVAVGLIAPAVVVHHLFIIPHVIVRVVRIVHAVVVVFGAGHPRKR